MIGSKTRQEFGRPGSGQKLLRHLDDRRYGKSSSYGLKTYRFTDNVCSILRKNRQKYGQLAIPLFKLDSFEYFSLHLN